MNTKQKIIQKSITLFNTQGISSVSLRFIADELGISVGNLQYHFKKREDVIESIYFQLVDDLNSIVYLKTDDLLKSFFNISTELIKIFYDYRFFFLDFATVVRSNQKIKSHYSELSTQREKEFLGFVEILIKNGLLREELLKNEYQNLFKRIEIMSNFWFSSVIIESDNLSKKTLENYSITIHQCMYPYLTKQAKKQYADMFN